MDVDFINFTYSNGYSNYYNKVTFHKHLYSEKKCTVVFNDLIIADDDFRIIIDSGYRPKSKKLKGGDEMKYIGIYIVVNKVEPIMKGKLTPPPSNVIHVMVISKGIDFFSEGFPYVFAEVDQRFKFDLLFDKKSDIGINGNCNALSIVYVDEKYAFKIGKITNGEIEIYYSKGAKNSGEFINTLDASKWDYDYIEPCATLTIFVILEQQLDSKLNIDGLKTVSN